MKSRIGLNRTGTIAGVAVLATLSAHAQFTFTDEAAFLAGVAKGYYLEDFSAYTYGSYIGASLSLRQGDWAYTITALGTQGLFSGEGEMSSNLATEDLRVSFSGLNVTAVGGRFYGTDLSAMFVPSSMRLNLSNGTSVTFTPTDKASSFRGFYSPGVPITSIDIFAPDMAGPMFIWPTIDHFYVGAVGAGVPESAGCAFMGGLGLLGFGVCRRFRRG